MRARGGWHGGGGVWAGIAALVVAAPVALGLAGCAAGPASRGDEAFRAGRYQEAARLYHLAALESPDDPTLVRKRDRAKRSAAEHYAVQAMRLLESRQLEAADRAAKAALRLDPANLTARAVTARVSPRLAAAKRAVRDARTQARKGDAVGALRDLETADGAQKLSGYPAVLREVRTRAAAQLRARAAKRLDRGEVAGANADLAEARRLAALVRASGGEVVVRGVGAPPAPARGSAPSAGASAPPRAGTSVPGTALPASDAARIERYAHLAAIIEAMTEGLPRRGRRGLARPEDYALPEEKVPQLRQAIDEALRLKLRRQPQPRWLTRGRLVLQMTNEVTAKRRLADAVARIGVGEVGAGLRLAASVAALDRDIMEDPEIAAAVRDVRSLASDALLAAAERASARGLPHLATVRARQAREVFPDAKERVDKFLDGLRSRTRAPGVVLYPFQDLSERDGVGLRLAERVRRAVSKRGIGPLVSFRDYTKARAAGEALALAGFLRAEVVRFETRPAPTPDEAWRQRIATLEARLRDARRVVVAATDRDSTLRGMERVDSLERRLARTRRQRGSAVFLPRAAGEAPQAVVTLEVRFGIYHPETGVRIVGEDLLPQRMGPKDQAKALEEAVIQEAAARIAEGVKRRLAEVGAGPDPASIGDPAARLDAQIARLERTAGVSARDPLVQDVVDGTGYSFATRATDLDRLRLFSE